MIRYGGIVAYSPVSLPVESLLSNDIGLTNIPDTMFSKSNTEDRIYKVRDIGHVCNVSIASTTASIGKLFPVKIDFDDCDESCLAIRAALLQTEKRSDDSILQVCQTY